MSKVFLAWEIEDDYESERDVLIGVYSTLELAKIACESWAPQAIAKSKRWAWNDWAYKTPLKKNHFCLVSERDIDSDATN
jgi:hypothetical protein